jgi:hypothetical protein
MMQRSFLDLAFDFVHRFGSSCTISRRHTNVSLSATLLARHGLGAATLVARHVPYPGSAISNTFPCPPAREEPFAL